MKKTIFFFLLFISIFSFSQEDFEGTIKFKFEFRDKTGKMSQEQIEQFLGKKQLYYLKKEKYKSIMNGVLKMTAFYNGNDTLFIKMKGTESLLYQPIIQKEKEKILSHKFVNITEKIAGIECKLLIVKTNQGIHKYYYSNDITINPKYYKNHYIGNWNYFMKMTNGGISIRHISDLKDSYQMIEAILIDKKPIDDSIFDRPKNLPITKMSKN